MGSIIDDLAGFLQQAVFLPYLRSSRARNDRQSSRSFATALSTEDGARSFARALEPARKTRAQSVARISSKLQTNSSFVGAASLENRQVQDDLSANQSFFTVTEMSQEELDRAEIERKLWAIFGEPAQPQAEPSNEAIQQLGKISSSKLEISENIIQNGRIVDIGKFLLDPNAVDVLEQIIRSGKVSELVRTMSVEQEAALTRLQDYLMKQPYVLSTVVLGNDGNVMSSRGGSRSDIDAVASWALCAYVNSRIAAELIGGTRLNHIVLSGELGTLIISVFGQALLVTITSTDEGEALSILLHKLEALLS